MSRQPIDRHLFQTPVLCSGNPLETTRKIIWNLDRYRFQCLNTPPPNTPTVIA